MLLLDPATDHAAEPASQATPTHLRLLYAWSGAPSIESLGRTLVLDPDCCFVAHHPTGAPSPDAATLGSLLCLDFNLEQIRLAAAGATLPHFYERLRLIEEPVASQLACLRRQPAAAPGHAGGGAPPIDLLRSLVAEDILLQRRAETIDCVKPGTRRELVRRVLLASDFILCHHAEPIRLDDVALAAHLSRFHLTRLFRQLLGVTPHALLLNKRLAAARRLLADGHCDMNEVAELSGFGNRWSLFRRLHRQPHRSSALRPQPSASASGRLPASD